jgi:hypothetical protein
MPIVRRAYLVAAPAWVAMLPFATYAATRVHASTLTHASAFLVYAIGSVVCHQKPERSFHLWGAQLPVCARCTGIYVGAALAVVMSRAQAFRPTEGSAAVPKSWATDRSTRTWIVLTGAPTIATLVFEWTSGVMPSNAVRFAAGLPLGAVVSWLILRPSPGLGTTSQVN